MSSPLSLPAAAAPLATLVVASCNVLNLALPSQVFYPNQEPYDEAQFERKVGWLGGMLARLGADVVGVQEVWHEAALKAAVERSGLQGLSVTVPGAEAGAAGTPRVGLLTRWPITALRSVADFAPGHEVPVPEIGLHTRFERPVLHAQLRSKAGLALHVLVAHLKSKRPKFLQDAAGQPLEDSADPRVAARATLRSLLMRAGEAAALRSLVLDITQGTREPLVLLGDMNDGPLSVTTQMIAANQAVAFDKGARDSALYHAWDVATEPALRRDLAYTHVHQGWPDLLDQVWVSEEFVARSRFAIGDVKRVEVFNDHLHEGRERWRSDHGFVRAPLRYRVGGGG